MSDHNLSARLWATAALLAVPFASSWGVGWWLPVHLAMLGAASQAIVGGQLMFSSTLSLSPGPSRRNSLLQLALLNIGGALLIAGRAAGSTTLVGAGATVFVVTVCWATWQVHRLWRGATNERFAVTGTFYRLAGISILLGASTGAALAVGAFDDPASYLAHRSVHMSLNVLGWVGLSVVGTAVTLLPTILHVRAPKVAQIRATPWLMFGALVVLSTGATFDWDPLAGAALIVYVAGLAVFGIYVRRMLAIPRRRKVPTAAFHLLAAIAWCAITAVGLIFYFTRGDDLGVRNLLVIGGAAGFVFQALLGAWSFLLPSTRTPVPDRRRRELVAMELGGHLQGVVYNAGLVAALVGLESEVPISLVGICGAWLAAVWALAKAWSFPAIGATSWATARSERWWAVPE